VPVRRRSTGRIEEGLDWCALARWWRGIGLGSPVWGSAWTGFSLPGRSVASCCVRVWNVKGQRCGPPTDTVVVNVRGMPVASYGMYP